MIKNNYFKNIIDIEHTMYKNSLFNSPHILQHLIEVWSLTEEDSYGVDRGVGKDSADHVHRTTKYYAFFKNHLLNDRYLSSLLPKEKVEESINYSYTAAGSYFSDTLYILNYEPQITNEIRLKYDDLKHYASLIENYRRPIKEGDDWRIKKGYSSLTKSEIDSKTLINS